MLKIRKLNHLYILFFKNDLYRLIEFPGKHYITKYIMKKNNQNRNTKKLLQSVIIIFVVISLDMISAKLFIPKNSLYNHFRTQHSYYHHSLTPYQSCKTNINIQNDRHANILNVPYI